ncbi:hydrogenase maturation protease [Microbispora sp. RL4-1S]|uniref:Hydrogenase maturation protease n=1 Tax=Microbispora oryzae TaxID=2806554 RepID=A0A940WIL5_9ACTN|nr:hydrogenase maturation protease [Microbispora oryzae]MBP2703927.1 hydrogenase maturation protease [Microbispora oryzae]
MSTPGRTVVVGFGGVCRGDDAAGIEVVRLLRGTLPPQVALVENRGDAAELIESWSGADLAVVVDAVRSGAPPGTVHRCHALAPGAGRHLGSHGLGLRDAVELARALGRLPRRLLIVGIEGADFTLGAAMTPAVRRAAGALADELAERFTRPAPKAEGPAEGRSP